MKFEHLIEVNDLANPLQAPLSREELWFGLLCRAEDARAFRGLARSLTSIRCSNFKAVS